MAITDPEAIKFVNEYIRPMCENVRYMNARGSDFALKWAAVGSDFPNDKCTYRGPRSRYSACSYP